MSRAHKGVYARLRACEEMLLPPLIPAKAGIQSLRKCSLWRTSKHLAKKTGSPLSRGDERKRQFLHTLEGGDRVTPVMLRSTRSPPSRGRQAVCLVPCERNPLSVPEPRRWER